MAEEKEKRKNDLFNFQIQFIMEAVKINCNMYDKITDPAVRAQMILSSFYAIVNTMIAFLKTPFFTDGILSQKNYEKMAEVADLFEKNLSFLIDWVQSPIYGPDHPIGKLMMEDSRDHFESKTNKKSFS